MRVGNGCIWGLAAAEAMSALGHKRTYAVRKRMSALPQKADMCGATRDVRFVPIADITHLRGKHGGNKCARTRSHELPLCRSSFLQRLSDLLNGPILACSNRAHS